MKTFSGKELSKIGIGSYGIGGRGHRDMAITEKLDDNLYINAVIHYLNRGVNFTEIALGYGHGESLQLFKKALDKSVVSREDVFLTHSIYPRDIPSPEILSKDIESFYQAMETDYADSTLVTQSLIMKFGKETIYQMLRNLLEENKTRYVSLSNANPGYIREFKEEFKNKFFAHEGHLSFEVRALEDKGILKICSELGVQNIIWRPLRRNLTAKQNWPLLVELAEKYGKTQNQVVLNWMCSLGYMPMVMSATKAHIDENIASTGFVMEQGDLERISSFRAPNYVPPAVEWDSQEIDDSIVALANGFEDRLGA